MTHRGTCQCRSAEGKAHGIAIPHSLVMYPSFLRYTTAPSSQRTRAERLATAFRSVLPPHVQVEIAKASPQKIQLKIAGRRISARWLASGWASEVLSQLKDPERLADVFVAAELSPRARELLSERGIGWIDESGASEIAIGTLVVSRTGRRVSVVKRSDRWTPVMIGVAEALLCGTTATVASVQRASGFSTGSCTNALRALTDLRLLEASVARGKASARRIALAHELLEAYATAAAALAPPISIAVGVTWRDPVAGLVELGEKWTRMNIGWAATGTIAAAILAPLLTTTPSATVYVTGHTRAALEAVARQSDLRPIEGGRLTLASFPLPSTQHLAETIAGMRVAPWPRVFTDLRGIGVRGEEAAEHLWEVVRGR